MVPLSRFLVSSLVASSSSYSSSTSSSSLSSTMTPASSDDSTASDPKLSIDHLVYVVPDLSQAMDDLEQMTGIRPAMGGRHVKLGTHNAFLGLGGGSFLELFAPDPEAEVPLQELIGVDGPKPRLSTYCCDAGAIGLDALVERFKRQQQTEGDDDSSPSSQLLPTSVESGSRTNEADGRLISWRIAVDKHSVPSEKLPMGGLLPFYIDWGDCRDVRPAVTTAPPGCTLLRLEAHHPDPQSLKRAIQSVGGGLEDLLEVIMMDDDTTTTSVDKPKLVAVIDTPNGEIRLS